MPQTYSLLRYPGGKASIAPMLTDVIINNKLQHCQYIEPYAGGGGLALNLLYRRLVSDIHLNDFDPLIWSFWYSALNFTDDFVDKIKSIDITLDEWHRQKEISRNIEDHSIFEVGFAAFFLNRTNRSGIISGGVIGGVDQTGKYKIDCRFTKKTAIEKLNKIKQFSHRIHLYNKDAVDFMKDIDGDLPKNSLFCIDPPYFSKGSSLYSSFYDKKDHKDVAKCIKSLKTKWILTYDNANEIKSLYPPSRQYNFNLNYSVQTKRKGTELLIHSRGIKHLESLNIEKCA
ncbi:DNA adenine methylase [Bermanella sp. R86510]|uniref:DNA adenine methylase n=1 Tax=unclassified Bermanella TaxID=2627862 RepID=UPI0037C97DAF